MHDRIDELVIDGEKLPERTVMTTWHENETARDVTAFFFNIAAVNERTLMVVVLDPNESQLARLLLEQASI